MKFFVADQEKFEKSTLADNARIKLYEDNSENTQ